MSKLDLTNYRGREHAYIKHYLLAKYLPRLWYKTGSKWDPLVFIDGFAGPWDSKDEEFTDASFGIAIRALNEAIAGLAKINRNVRGVCVFVEKEPQPFAKLDAFAKKYSTELVRAVAFQGRFIEKIPEIDQYISSVGNTPFKLVFLDQKGWAAAPISDLKKFVGSRSCELLFNVMTSFLTRFLDRRGMAQSYYSLFGRSDVIDKIRALPKRTGEREEAAVEEYCRSLREICRFRYVSQAVILDASKERVRYYFVFATNSLHGIQVFKNAEAQAAEAQDEIRHETKLQKQAQFGLPFGGPAPKSSKALALQKRYLSLLRKKIENTLRNSRSGAISYDELYGEAMSFPLITESDLNDILLSLYPSVELHLAGARRKKPMLFKGDYVRIHSRSS